MQKGGGGIHAKMRQTKQNLQQSSSAPIESRVLLKNGRTVNTMHHQQRPIEQRLKGPIRPSLQTT